jgi:hypothetical protein
MLRLALAALSLVALADPRLASAEQLDCARERADVHQLFQDHSSERMRFAAPLAQAAKHVLDRTLTEEDQQLVQAFGRGRASAAKLDRALWPKLRPVFDRFNRAGCRDLGGVVAAADAKTELLALRAGTAVHTGVLVTCARAPLQGETRRFLGLRVRRGEDGPKLSLYGFIQARVSADAAHAGEQQWSGVVLDVPLGDRAASSARLEQALASFAGLEEDFSWAVPAACKERVSAVVP